MFGVVLAWTLAGLLFFLVLPLARETPFLVRQTFMLIWLYMVPALWVSDWLPAARGFRCLPLSRIRLAVLPVMYAMLICLAGGVSVGVVMVLTERATSVFTPLLWWLLLCPGLLSLFYSVAVRSGPVRSAKYGLGIWTMLVVMGNLTRDFFFISRAFRGGPTLDRSHGSVLACRNCWPSPGTRGLSRLLAQPCHAEHAISTNAAVRARIVIISILNFTVHPMPNSAPIASTNVRSWPVQTTSRVTMVSPSLSQLVPSASLRYLCQWPIGNSDAFTRQYVEARNVSQLSRARHATRS